VVTLLFGLMAHSDISRRLHCAFILGQRGL
jgi:hypothetical protein